MPYIIKFKSALTTLYWFFSGKSGSNSRLKAIKELLDSSTLKMKEAKGKAIKELLDSSTLKMKEAKGGFLTILLFKHCKKHLLQS